MDEDYLTRRQEEEMARAASAATDEARQSHEALAQHYADRLATLASTTEPA